MFTGIVKGLGVVVRCEPYGSGRTLWIQQDVCTHVHIGDSLSINGVCSTVVESKSNWYRFDYLEESIAKTHLGDIQVGDRVNVEDALSLHDKLGGHIVTGHVDSVGSLYKVEKDDPWHVVWVEYPASFYPFLIPKGSISVDGVSLTIVDVTKSMFSCHIIPHTYQETRLSDLLEGARLNLEFDMMAKYMFHFYQIQQEGYSERFELNNREDTDHV